MKIHSFKQAKQNKSVLSLLIVLAVILSSAVIAIDGNSSENLTLNHSFNNTTIMNDSLNDTLAFPSNDSQDDSFVISNDSIIENSTTRNATLNTTFNKTNTTDNGTTTIIENISSNFSNGLRGTIINGSSVINNSSSFYLKLGDENITSMNISVLSSNQEEVVVGKEVILTQTLSVHNSGDEIITPTINLWDVEVGTHLINSTTSLEVYDDDVLISEQPLFSQKINPGQTIDLRVVYTLPPVLVETFCNQTTLQDTLPEDATILNHTIDPNTVLGTTCRIDITHAGKYPYKKFLAPINISFTGNLKTITNAKTGEELVLTENKLIL
ncbi:MAG: hypothetical protein ACQESC_01335 [Nanobdellota archaeon]